VKSIDNKANTNQPPTTLAQYTTPTSADQVAARALAKLVKDAVSVLLLHARVDENARVAELGDLLGKQLNTRVAVAKDNGLVDLQRRGMCYEGMRGHAVT
jgi:hypothetical protein